MTDNEIIDKAHNLIKEEALSSFKESLIREMKQEIERGLECTDYISGLRVAIEIINNHKK